MVVTPPAVAVGRFYLEDRIDDLERVDDEWVVGTANTVADELEETTVDDLARFKVVLLVRSAVGDVDHAGRDVVVVEGLSLSRWTDAHVVVRNVRVKDAAVSGSPLVEMGFDPVGIAFEEAAEFAGAVRTHDVCSADQRRDYGCERGGRVACVFFPTLLLRDRSIANEERRGVADEAEDIEVAEAIELPQTPREDDGKRYFVKLDAGPVRRSIDPEVLREATVRMLRTGEVDQRAASGVDASASQQCGCGLHHVPRPDEVIAAEIVIGLRGSPRDRRRGDKRAGVGLVLMREDDVVGDASQLAVVGRGRGQPLRRDSAMPLLDEALAMHIVGR